jgi:O-antigen/teichoic acid export membrane protein
LLCSLALVVTFLSKFVVSLLYGSEFIVSHEILRIIIWTIPITYLGIITNRLLIIKGLQKVVFWKQILLLSLNITLNLILMPKYGIVGAAWATLLADIVVNFLSDLFFTKAMWIFRLKLKALLFISEK